MKALVIAASGMLGGSLARVLENSGFDVTGTFLKHPAATNKTIRLDITDRASVDQAFEQLRPEVVFVAVNVPGGVDACEQDPKLTAQLNVEGTENVLNAAVTL